VLALADIEVLRAQLRELGSVVVAFSGGADSAFLANIAHQELGYDRCIVITAVSPSLAPEEELECGSLASEWGFNWRAVYTDELANHKYSVNDGQRCYFCKAELMDVLLPVASEVNAKVILGVNVDDLGDYRPGQSAASERGGVFPLVEAGFTKEDVRSHSRDMGLRTWDKPAAACLSSRIPYGTPVTLERLTTISRAESALRLLGFREFRVRHYDDTARIEVGIDELPRAIDLRIEIVAAIHEAGYRYVTLDLEGLRSGNLNGALLSRGSAASA